ncbi:MAG TPA: sigma-70 family RNA polymerase sigma factor [Schlesneria sp.]
MDGLPMLDAIDHLAEDEREVFSLIRIQGMTHVEAAEITSVASKTIKRRFNRSLIPLSKSLSDLRPSAGFPEELYPGSLFGSVLSCQSFARPP